MYILKKSPVLILLATAALSRLADASPTLVEKSWGYTFEQSDTFSNIEGRGYDTHGGEYVLSKYRTGGGSFETLRKFDQFGNVLWTSPVPLADGELIEDLQVDAQSNVIICGGYTNSSLYDVAFVSEFDASGQPRWTQTYPDPDKLNSTAYRIGFDTANNIYVAMSTDKSSGPNDLTVVKYATNGAELLISEMTQIAPSGLFFDSMGTLLVTGFSNLVANTEAWSHYDADGNYLNGALITNTSSGGIDTTYQFTATFDNAGNYYVGQSAHINQASGQSNNHALVCYSPSDTLKWTVGNGPGRIDTLEAADPGHVYVAGNSASYATVVMYNATGHTFWGRQLNGVPRFAFDGTNGWIIGIVVIGANSDKTLSMQKYTPSGVADWGLPFYPLPPIGWFDDFVEFHDGVLRIGGIQQSGTGYEHFLQNYVQGTSLQSIGFSKTQYLGGTKIQGTVTLNGPAPVGGLDVNLDSSDYGYIVPTSTVHVSAWASSVPFFAETAAVDVATPVTLTAQMPNIQRTVTITIEPALLSTVTLGATTLQGGKTVAGTVTLTGKAGLSGRTVTLKSSDVSVGTVPASVSVAPDGTSVQYVLTSKHVTSAKTLTITATSGAITKTATISITP